MARQDGTQQKNHAATWGEMIAQAQQFEESGCFRAAADWYYSAGYKAASMKQWARAEATRCANKVKA